VHSKRWLLGLSVAAGLTGCGNLFWSSDGKPADPIGEPEPFEPDFARPVPERLPNEPVIASRPLPAISGGTLTISPDGTYAVASDPDRDAVHVVTLVSGQVSTTQLERGAEPGRVVFDAAGTAHIVLRGKGAIARLTPSTNNLKVTPVCAMPRGIAYANGDASIAVACASGDLVRLSAADHTVRSTRFLDVDLRDVLVKKDGTLQVSRFRQAELLNLDAKGALVNRLKPQRLRSFRFNENGDQQVTLSPAVSWRASYTPDNKVLMLHQRAQDEEVMPSPGGYGGFGDCSAITQPAVSLVDDQNGDSLNFGLAGVALAVDAAVSPDGRWLAVADPSGYLLSRDTMFLYSATGGSVVGPSPFPGEFSDAGVGSTDGGADPAISDAACQFSVSTAGWDSQFTAVAFTKDGRILAQSRQPAQLQLFNIIVQPEDYEGAPPWASLEPSAVFPLSRESVVDTGHDLFHADVGGGVTCASCHGENGDDAHVWNFSGIGPRRTQTMRGGLKGSEPLHWDGDMVDFKHLVDEVMTGRMSGFPVKATFTEALINWIDVQPSLRLPVADALAADRGKRLFESRDTGCTSCHSGGAPTNNGSFDVGTGGKFQVPSLRGLGLRAPYMHDGCATTLTDRFVSSCGGGDKHGKTSQLSAAQVQDLVTYLKSL